MLPWVTLCFSVEKMGQLICHRKEGFFLSCTLPFLLLTKMFSGVGYRLVLRQWLEDGSSRAVWRQWLVDGSSRVVWRQ